LKLECTENEMKVVSWNMRRATDRSTASWEYFQQLNPDLAFLQEVNSFPAEILKSYNYLYKKVLGKTGRTQPFGTAILAKGEVIETLPFTTEWAWVNDEIARLEGSIVAAKVVLSGKKNLMCISVHSPAWPIDRVRLQGIDSTVIKLSQNPDVWGTELLWAMLRTQNLSDSEWIVAGDLNSSETFDYFWSSESRGNKEILVRMQALGFKEVLRESRGILTPTFRNPKGGKIVHQLDHMFVSKSLSVSLRQCTTGDPEHIFGNSLSDHLPIIAEFAEPSQERKPSL
jgi:endonuclease/exonuclease/phosphatase family metal-dependent hydrolase